MSELPKHVRVGHMAFRVVRSNRVIQEEESRSQRSLAGYSNAVDQTIALREGMGRDYEADTVLHEVLHTCFRVSGYDPDDDKNPDIEERTISAITGPLLGALRANPQLVAYLTAKVKK